MHSIVHYVLNWKENVGKSFRKDLSAHFLNTISIYVSAEDNFDSY